MTRADCLSRLRAAPMVAFLSAVAVAGFAIAVALFLIGVAGIALLVEGLLSWVHPHDVASAWARTFAGAGLIGASIGLAALGWLAGERLVSLLGESARRRYRALDPASGRNPLIGRRLKFAAV